MKVKAESDRYSSDLKRVEKLADLFDSKFKLPGTEIRFGWDSIIGLIPGLGDSLTLLPQIYFVSVAYKLGLGWHTIVKMIGNIALDWVVGLVPLLGDLFDVAFKSNLRNARLLKEAIERRRLDSES